MNQLNQWIIGQKNMTPVTAGGNVDRALVAPVTGAAYDCHCVFPNYSGFSDVSQLFISYWAYHDGRETQVSGLWSSLRFAGANSLGFIIYSLTTPVSSNNTSVVFSSAVYGAGNSVQYYVPGIVKSAGWYHICFYHSATTTNSWMGFNTENIFTPQSAPITSSSTPVNFLNLATTTAANTYPRLAHIYFISDFTNFAGVDFSKANAPTLRQSFASAGKPLHGGSDGSSYLGAVPSIYISCGTDTLKNDATGAALTFSGTDFNNPPKCQDETVGYTP